MKIGVSHWAMDDWPLEEALPVYREVGVSGIEVPIAAPVHQLDDPTPAECIGAQQQAQHVGQLIRDHGLEVASASCGFMIKHGTNRAVVEAGMEAAVALGASVVRIMGACCADLSAHSDPFARQYDGTKVFWDLYEDATHELEVLVECARERGLRLAMELHDGYLCESMSAAYLLLQHFDPRDVGVLVDPENMIRGGIENWKMGLELIDEYLSHFHVKNMAWGLGDGPYQRNGWRHVRTSLDAGLVDWAQIVQLLAGRNFDGYLCIEDLRHEIPAETRLRECYDYLHGLIETTR